MKAISTEKRKVQTDCGEIVFTFERKCIKNINLRIRHDGNVFVSAPETVPENIVDTFIINKCKYIKKAVESFEKNDLIKSEKQYVDGENIIYLGRNLRIKIIKDSKEYVDTDGVFIYVHVMRPDYYNRKKNLINDWTSKQCNAVFTEIINDVYQKFASYGVNYPILMLRNMTSRWGSCLVDKHIITLNLRLIEAPKSCIEYVVYHEFCHFVHPDHSKQFYLLLQVMMPNWKERKLLLEKSIVL